MLIARYEFRHEAMVWWADDFIKDAEFLTDDLSFDPVSGEFKLIFSQFIDLQRKPVGWRLFWRQGPQVQCTCTLVLPSSLSYFAKGDVLWKHSSAGLTFDAQASTFSLLTHEAVEFLVVTREVLGILEITDEAPASKPLYNYYHRI